MSDFISQRRRKARIHVVLQLLLLLWIVWVVNVWSFHQSIRIDWSQGSRMEVTASDRELLEALPRMVEVLVPLDIDPSASGRVRLRVLSQALRWLDELSQAAPGALRLPVSVDVNRDGDRWEVLRSQRGLEADAVNRIHLFCGERRLSLDVDDLALIRGTSPLEPEQLPVVEVDRVRESIEAALRQIVHDQLTEIRISQGSGELPLEGSRGVSLQAFCDDLEARGAHVTGVDLTLDGVIETDTDLLLVIGGGIGRFEPLGASVRRAIDRHLDNGGGVLVLLPSTGICGLEDTMAAAGISVLPGLVAEITALPGAVTRPSYAAVGTRLDPFHPVTASLARDRIMVRYMPSRALQVSEPATALLATGPGAWLEREPGNPRRQREETPGPQILAAAAEVGAGRLVVVGNWSTVLPGSWRLDARRFLLACCDWACGRDLLPAGAGREPVSNRIELDDRIRRSFFWTTSAVLPGCALLGGLLMAWARRKDS
ncbi:MAG: hypothetical protein VYD70_03395 [Planctomycetota bacterium]|nr:hypothetical protein [Planctomycetota bacterium]